MSHKNKKYAHAMIPHEVPGRKTTKTTEEKTGTTTNSQSRLTSIAGTLRNHLGLITTIGAACTAAAVLAGTQKGRSLASQALDTVSDGAGRWTNYVVDRGKHTVQSVRDMFPTPPSKEEIREKMEFDEKIHQLQDKFRLVA